MQSVRRRRDAASARAAGGDIIQDIQLIGQFQTCTRRRWLHFPPFWLRFWLRF
jgi:hypothetical protein